MLESPAVDTVVSCVQTALWEPDDVACLKSARSNGFEGAIPVQHRVCLLDEQNI